MEKYIVIALSVSARRGVKNSGDIVTQDNFSTPVEDLVEQGFLKPYTETEEDNTGDIIPPEPPSTGEEKSITDTILSTVSGEGEQPANESEGEKNKFAKADKRKG